MKEDFGGCFEEKSHNSEKKENGIQPPHLLVPSGPNPHLYRVLLSVEAVQVPD